MNKEENCGNCIYCVTAEFERFHCEVYDKKVEENYICRYYKQYSGSTLNK